MTGITHQDPVDWPSLIAEHGTPVLIDQFRAVCGGDEVAADHAIEIIADSTTAQYTRYACSPESVPFLIAILRTPGAAPRWRHDLLRVLTVIAVGSDRGGVPGGPPLDAMRRAAAEIPPEHQGLDEHRYVRERWQARRDGADDGSPDAVGDIRAYWAVVSYLVVEESVADLLPLLDDADEHIRAGTAYLLGWFPGQAALIVPALRAARDADDAAPAATAMLALAFGMAENGRADDTDALWLASLLAERKPLTAWAAAVALARMTGADTPDTVVAELLAWASAERSAPPGTRLPFVDNNPAAIAARALTGTGPGRLAETVDAMCAGLLRADADGAHELIETLLAAAFPDGPVADGTAYTDLTEPQRRTIAAAALAEEAWDLGTFQAALDGYGLSFTEPGDWRTGGVVSASDVERHGLTRYAGLADWGHDRLVADAAIPGRAPAAVTVEALPTSMRDEIRAHLWEVVREAFDSERLDTYVDEPGYREAAERWLRATEEHVTRAYPAMDVRAERTGPLSLSLWVHPFAAVRSPAAGRRRGPAGAA